MTRKEIMLNTTWDEFEMGTCRLFVNFFDQYIPFIFFQEHKPTPDISAKMIRSINEVLALEEDQLDTLKDRLHEAYLSTYVIEDNAIAGLNKEEVYLKSKVKEIHIDQENDKLNGVYSEIIMHTASVTLMSIVVKDGKIMYHNDDAYLDALED